MAYYDLNIPAQQDPNVLKDILLFMTKLGYDSVALTHTVDGKISPKDICKIQKIDFNDDDEKKNNNNNNSNEQGLATSSGWLKVGTSKKSIKQYTRLEVVVKNNAELQMLNSNNPVVQSYDLISIIPTDINVFNAACNSTDIDIITLTSFSKFIVKPDRIRQCIQKGISIELVYTSIFEKESERLSFFQLASSVVRSSFGKNIILSSRGKHSKFMRSPYDISNLGHLFGLNFDQAKASVSKLPHSAILHGLSRKTKGLALVSDPALLRDLELWKLERKDDVTPTGNTVPHPKNKKPEKKQDIENDNDADDQVIEQEPKTTTTTTTTTTNDQIKSKSKKSNEPSVNKPSDTTTTKSTTIKKENQMDVDHKDTTIKRKRNNE
ncbi:hypothetical protein CYY_003086 [Polysphondylium violaceum]|uniref:Uncharacterized protein n=1 Tax=Polysphondylium violaceum TaxID=133409 RepID=A0A8J4PVB6_9MYCE|nr:hypothetical protein CYY_003086 [Polysphondylium violaceum]